MPTETPKRKEISPATRDLIVQYIINESKSYQEVARAFKINEKSVRWIVLRYNENQTVVPSARGGSRADGLTPSIANTISTLMNNNNAYNLHDI